MINFYKILGLRDFASLEEIKVAFRKLSKKFHPDVNDGDKFFEQRFMEIQEAYQVLSDGVKRVRYDADLRRSLVTDNFKLQSVQKDQPAYINLRSGGLSTQRKPELVKPQFSKKAVVIIAVTLFALSTFLFLLVKDEQTLEEAQEKLINNNRFISIGSSRQEVTVIQGHPTKQFVYGNVELWYYNGSSVTFTEGKVSEISNADSNLKVRVNNVDE